MNTEKILKNTKTTIMIGLTTGFLLLLLGLTIGSLNKSFEIYRKGIVALSFIPFSVSIASYIKLRMVKSNPVKMKNLIISESDERLITIKNEADAKAFRIVQAAVFMSYMGYTLLVPEDIFKAVGWWILLTLLLVTFVSQGIIAYVLNKPYKSGDEE